MGFSDYFDELVAEDLESSHMNVISPLLRQDASEKEMPAPNITVLKDFTDSLKYAAVVQQSILPKQRHFDRLFSESFVSYLPKQMVSGDFYWLGEPEGLIYLAVGDCTGHGVPGAMLSVLTHALLGYAIMQKKIKKANRILKDLDARFMESFSALDETKNVNNDWVDISRCCIEKKKKTIFFSGAHRKIMLATPKELKIFNGNSYPVGGWQIEKNRTYNSTFIPYSKGEVLYLGSDGFQDQIGGNKNKKYKSRKLHKLIYSKHHLPMSEQKGILEDEFIRWKGENEQTDDVTVIGVRL